jgi:hypothetical protein
VRLHLSPYVFLSLYLSGAAPFPAARGPLPTTHVAATARASPIRTQGGDDAGPSRQRSWWPGPSRPQRGAATATAPPGGVQGGLAPSDNGAGRTRPLLTAPLPPLSTTAWIRWGGARRWQIRPRRSARAADLAGWCAPVVDPASKKCSAHSSAARLWQSTWSPSALRTHPSGSMGPYSVSAVW